VPRSLLGRLRLLGSALGDVVRGATGAQAYAQYLAHLARHHPDRQPLSREAFFRSELSSRWDGVRRCC
jgi:uncharacterized short protein YbdD (DUF466 family)